MQNSSFLLIVNIFHPFCCFTDKMWVANRLCSRCGVTLLNKKQSGTDGPLVLYGRAPCAVLDVRPQTLLFPTHRGLWLSTSHVQSSSRQSCKGAAAHLSGGPGPCGAALLCLSWGTSCAAAVCCRRFAERCCCRGSTRAGDERSSVPQQRLSRSNACVQSWRAVPFFSLLFLCSLVLRAATSACSEGRSGVSSPVTALSPPVPTGRSLTCSNTCTETWKQLLFSLSALFHESMVCSSSSSAGSGSNGFICTKHSRSGAPARSPQRSSSVRSAPHCIFGPRRAL